jgi:hypothetical protein
MAPIFEAPAAHDSGGYGPREWEGEAPVTAVGEWETEWEQSTTDGEWELPEAQEMEWEQPFTSEWEMASELPGSQEWEQSAAGEWEWEQPGAAFGEAEWEADAFSFGGLLSGIGNIAKKVAPGAVKALASMVPGAGPLIAPALGNLTQSLLSEAEARVAEAEAEAFGGSQGEAEVGGSETAQEAALSELLAADAAETRSAPDALSTISATLPVTIRIMRADRPTRAVVPTLTRANTRLSRSLMRHGPRGRQLLRAVPTIQRLGVGTMQSAARSGRPVTPPVAVGSMAAATRRVLGNPRRAEAVIRRNAALRQRTAPPYPRRPLVYQPRPAVAHHPHHHAGYGW